MLGKKSLVRTDENLLSPILLSLALLVTLMEILVNLYSRERERERITDTPPPLSSGTRSALDLGVAEKMEQIARVPFHSHSIPNSYANPLSQPSGFLEKKDPTQSHKAKLEGNLGGAHAGAYRGVFITACTFESRPV